MIRKHAILIFCLSFLASIFYHGWNWRSLYDQNPERLRKGITVSTADDPSYLAPVENYLLGKGWRSNAVGRAAWLSRSPGYGLIYGSVRLFLSERNALVALVLLQMALWAMACAAVPDILKEMKLPFGFQTALFLAIWPAFGGFLSYTLTEGVTPALTLLFFWALIKAKTNQIFFLAASLGGLIALIRPSLLPLALVLPITALFIQAQAKWKLFAISSAIILIPLFLWQTYISIRAGEVQSLHPIYQSDANDLYRPLHGAIWNFHKSWGAEGMEFHQQMNILWSAADANSCEAASRKVLSEIPSNVTLLVGEVQLEDAYMAYCEILTAQQPYFKANMPVLAYSEKEDSLQSQFEDFAKAYRREYWFQYALVTPAHVFWNLSAHSNLNLYLFQGHLRGNWAMELLRGISFAIHLLSFLIFPFAVYYMRRERAIFIIGLAILSYLGYLCFVQRGVEERYTAAVFPIMITTVILALITIYENGRVRRLKF